MAYGRAATEALRAAIRTAQAGDPLAPVTVVVPSNLAGLSARRTLAEQGGHRQRRVRHAVRVSPSGSAVPPPRRPGSRRSPSRCSWPRSASSSGTQPGFFGPVAEHAATESALARRYAELSRARPETCERIRRSGTRAGTGARRALRARAPAARRLRRRGRAGGPRARRGRNRRRRRWRRSVRWSSTCPSRCRRRCTTSSARSRAARPTHVGRRR